MVVTETDQNMTSTEKRVTIDESLPEMRSTINDPAPVILEEAIDFLKKQAQKTEEENQSLLKKADDLQALKKQVSYYLERIAQLEDEIVSAKKDSREQESRNKFLESKLETNKMEVDRIEQDNKNLKSKIQKFEDLLRSEQENTQMLKKQNSMLHSENTDLKAKLTEISADLRVNEYHQRSEIAKLHKEHIDKENELIEEVVKLTDTLTREKEIFERMRQKCQSQDKQLSEQTSIIEKQNKEMDQMFKEIDKLNQQIGQQKGMNEVLRKRVNELAREKVNSCKLIDSLKDALRKAHELTENLGNIMNGPSQRKMSDI